MFGTATHFCPWHSWYLSHQQSFLVSRCWWNFTFPFFMSVYILWYFGIWAQLCISTWWGDNERLESLWHNNKYLEKLGLGSFAAENQRIASHGIYSHRSKVAIGIFARLSKVARGDTKTWGEKQEEGSILMMMIYISTMMVLTAKHALDRLQSGKWPQERWEEPREGKASWDLQINGFSPN